MKTVTVTIGRNVGDEPLPAAAWNDYTADTRRAVEAVTVDLWAVAPYRGSWEGQPEDAVILYGSLIDVDGVVEALRQRLATLATYYGQQAIGLSVGSSELVESYAGAATAELVA